MPIEDHPLRLARLRAGLGQRELAERVGMNRSSISAIEEGRTNTPTDESASHIEGVLSLPAGTLNRSIREWAAKRKARGVAVTPHARAVLKMDPAELPVFRSFVHWRQQISPSATAFASLLGVNRAVVTRYEEGIRQRGMPDTLSHALLSVLHITNDYLLALQRLEPCED